MAEYIIYIASLMALIQLALGDIDYRFSDEIQSFITNYDKAIQFYSYGNKQLKEMYYNILEQALKQKLDLKDVEKLSYYIVFDQQATKQIEESKNQHLKDIQMAQQGMKQFDQQIYSNLLVAKLLKVPITHKEFNLVIEMYELILQKQVVDDIFLETLNIFLQELHIQPKDEKRLAQELKKQDQIIHFGRLFRQNLANQISKNIKEAKEHIVNIEKFRQFVFKLQETMHDQAVKQNQPKKEKQTTKETINEIPKKQQNQETKSKVEVIETLDDL